ncbi:MAG: ATP-dependent 6-phosphofructokinase [Acidobacteria bacterium]|nr:ATP-dependent 6-phosphofructokinase [Acidobacteriota bacterium]
MIRPEETVVPTLGEPRIESPLRDKRWESFPEFFIHPESRVRYQVEVNTPADRPGDVFFEKAGPREKIFFDPQETRAAIVTCGGLSPGLNNVVRSASLELYHNYGVREIFGVRYGYQGLNPAEGQPPIPLTPEFVGRIQDAGGSVLGSSRGAQDPAVMVNYLKRERINLLLCLGGEGTQNGALQIHREASRRGYPLAVVGIPKTIDNDIPYVSMSFGFNTAIEKSREVLECAHNEAKSAPNGIGLVKLMGRHAGFIACGATLASQEVNFCLIPEVPFSLEGEHGLLHVLHKRILNRGHAVVVVAEGAGQDLFAEKSGETDASGNVRLHDVGELLRDRIREHCKRQDTTVEVKYFDPSYFIRSVPANATDRVLSDQLARYAVHAGMAGMTGVLVGHTNNVFTYVPIALSTSRKKRVFTDGSLWRSVLAATGQPAVFH